MDRRSGGYELVILSSEYAKQLSSIVINIANKLNIKYYLFHTFFFDLYIYYLFFDILGSHCSQYYSIICKIIDEISTSLSSYINILSFVLCHLNNVASYIPIILSIFHCVHSEIIKLSDCLICYVEVVKSSFHCYITKLTLDIQCVINIEQMGEYVQNMVVSIQTCTNEFEQSICSEIEKLKSICFYPARLFSIRDNLSKIKNLLSSNKDELSKINSSINIYNIHNLMTYINMNCEMIDPIKSEISSLIIYVHEYGLYFNSICCYISCLKSKFCESVQKLKASVDLKIQQCFSSLKCDLTTLEIDIICEIPDFSHITTQIDSINSIIQCHENDLHIYDCEIEQCLSCIKCDNGCLKLYSRKIDQILRNGYLNKAFFKCYFDSNMKLLRKINSYIMGVKDETNSIDSTYHNVSTNNTSSSQINNVLINLTSKIVIDESIFVVSRIYVYYKTKDLINETLKLLERCVCLQIYNRNWRDKIETFDKPFPNINYRYYNPIIMSLMMTHVLNYGNYMCLCLVVRYILLNDLYVVMTYKEYLCMDLLSCMTRSYNKYSYSIINIFNLSKLMMLIITTLDKIILWMKNIYIGDKIHCYCYDVNSPYYSYLISIILFVSSLVENMWIIDSQSVRMAIDKISSLLSEYQSLHVYTNYYSASRYNIIRFISGLTNGRLTQVSSSHFGLDMGVQVKDKKSLVSSGLTNTTILSQSKDSSATSTSLISSTKTNATGILNNSTKGCFMSLRTMILGTRFSKERFTLIYGKFSLLSFYAQKFSIINTGTIKNMRNIGATISLNYLQEVCRQPCDQTCCKKNGLCRICPMAKIMVSCLYISLKRIEVVLSNVSADMLLNYLIESIDRSRDFITNLCVGFGEVYTIMLKNTHLTSNSYPGSNNTTNVTSVRNWGYDTRYEHRATTVSNHKLSPKLITVNHGTIDTTQNMVTHLAVVPT